MGFVISGTDRDGPHYQVGAYNFSYTDPNPPLIFAGTRLNATGGCQNCNGDEGFKSATFTVGAGATAGTALQDPLYYAAKYGNFTGTYTGGALDVTQWDTKKTDGSPGADGIPDAYFYAINPAELERSIRTIFGNLVPTGGTSPAVTGSRISAGGQLFLTTYTNTTTDFGRGEITAYSVLPDGSQATTANWTAAAQLTARSAGSRAIITNNAGVGQPFQWNTGNLSVAQQLALNTSASNFVDGRGSARLDYLRGNRSNENAGFFFRPRISLLGDILNSTPWFVGAPTGAYSNTLYPGFSSYFNTYRNRRSMIYVGANDGFLHGFDATTGAEIISFVPTSVYKNLSKLTDPAYTTRTFVDGAVFAGDANVGGWKTFLIGSPGRGGQSIFALDVTNPANLTEGNASNIFKWEFSEADDVDIGNIIGNPTLNPQTNAPRQIAQMSNNRWAVVTGNGYGSDNAADNKGVPDTRVGSGGAVMYVLFLDGPTGSGNTWVPTTGATGTGDYVKIPLFDPGCGVTILLSDDRCRGAGPNNGLGTVTPIDLDGDGKVDFLYAADLKGNVWRVDVTGAPSSWATNYSRLFSAAYPVTTPTPGLVAQPITTAVNVVPHPFGGAMVNFVTGRSLSSPDLNDLSQQTAYGIWDRPRAPALPTGAVYPVSSDRSRLVAQGTGNVLSANSQFRTGTFVDVDFNTKDGWYYDLPFIAEKAIFNSYYNDDDTLVFDTVFNRSSGTTCRADTSIVLNLLNAISGKPPERSFDINGDNLINSQDKITVVTGLGSTKASASGAIIDGGVSGSTRFARPSITIPPKGPGSSPNDKCVDKYANTVETGGTKSTLAGAECAFGRIYWREITRDAQ
ncbi:MAG: hypothetical protein K2X63_10340 [Burkholderiaceae bacterium]|nr:hypothetical protein [Burkholderiaceae bacterium]